jgi:hypothetical protein
MYHSSRSASGNLPHSAAKNRSLLGRLDTSPRTEFSVTTGVKDVQGVLGHSKADTTVNVYMQSIEAGVKQTLDAIYSELTTPEMRAEL